MRIAKPGLQLESRRELIIALAEHANLTLVGFARDDGYDSVLTLGVDSLGVPDNLLELLSPAPAFIESQPVIGHWPTGTVDVIETLLLADDRHSMLAFAEAVGATAVKIGAKPANINTPADLAAAEKTNGI